MTPVVRALNGHAALDGIFFARYSDPDWQLRFRVLGRPSWIEAEVKPRVDDALRPARAAGLFTEVEFATYQREWERYGGERGMRLAEAIFFHDSLACLDVIDAEHRGALLKTRREYSLLFVERFLDLLGFDREARIAYYAFAHSWPIEDGTWTDADLETLGAKYEALEPGLVDLLRGSQAGDLAAQCGGEEPARILERCLAATKPVIEEVTEGLRSGAIAQDRIPLVWSYTHMHCNRLGIEAVPEAILRYFMWRLYTGTGLAD